MRELMTNHAPGNPAAFLPFNPSPAAATVIAAMLLTAALAIAVLRCSGSRRPVLPVATRVRLRLWPGTGFARGRLELRRTGLPRARQVARRARPDLTWRDRRLGPWQQYASLIGRAHGWPRASRVYSHLEQVRLTIAAPQKGKSAAAACSIIDAPGPVVATSIRGDLIAATAGLRARSGQVHVFNPEGAGGYGSTITWNPVSGCQDMTTAARRAGYMVEGVAAHGLEDASFWQDQAAMALAALLHAAGLAGGSMQDVYMWVTEDDAQPARILAAHPGAAPTALGDVASYLEMPPRTRAGVSANIRAAIRFMQDPRCAALLCPDGAGSFDPEEFARSTDTLYLVASDSKHTPVPPVFTALIAEVTHAARQAAQAAGRLFPPLCLELDEAANIAPVPVAAWATWAAGTGIRMSVYAQAYSQLAERWGTHGAEVLWQASDVKVIHAESSEDTLCRLVEHACGQVAVRGPDTIQHDAGGRRPRAAAWTTEAVLPYAALRELPKGHAVVIQGGARPVIVRTEQYWRRRDFRRLARLGGGPVLPAPAPPAVPDPVPGLMRHPAAGMPLADELAMLRRTRTGWLARPLAPAATAAAVNGLRFPYGAEDRQ
jgi:type IV secretion system protein VirD4